MKKLDLSKEILILISASGILSYKNKADSYTKVGSLPCYSTDTADEAMMLIVAVAKRAYSNEYYIPDFEGTSDAIFDLSELLRNIDMKINSKGERDG